MIEGAPTQNPERSVAVLIGLCRVLHCNTHTFHTLQPMD